MFTIMKKFKKTYFRVIDKIIALLAAFVGLQGCYRDVMPAYGIPTVDFHISGRVENKLSQGISGIEVAIKGESSYCDCESAIDTTDVDGFFEINCLDYNHDSKYWLVANDIDSSRNRGYKSDSILFIVPCDKIGDDDYWRHSHDITERDLTVILEEKGSK